MPQPRGRLCDRLPSCSTIEANVCRVTWKPFSRGMFHSLRAHTFLPAAWMYSTSGSGMTPRPIKGCADNSEPGCQ